MATTLDDVERALLEGDFARALEHAIALWQQHRYAVLADLVDSIAERLPKITTAAPLPRGQDPFHTEWLVRARNMSSPLDSIVLSSVARSVPMPQRYYWAQGTAAQRYAAWLLRIDALAERQPDPRIAMAVATVLEKAPFTSVTWDVDSFVIYGPLLTLLERTNDERVIPRLAKLIEVPTASRQSIRRYLASALPTVKEKLEELQRARGAIDPALAEAAESVIDLAGGRPKKGQPRPADVVAEEQALFDMVLEDPDDDDARAVLGDFLIEQGDPRGELINLQLKEARGEATEADHKATRSILRAHEKTWLGDLALVTKRRVFRRGFLDEVELQQNSAAEAHVWEATSKSPLLATVRVLRKGKANEQHYRAFLFSPALRSIRRLTLQRKAMLDDVTSRLDPTWPIRELVLTFAPDKTSIDTLLAAKDKAFPRLTKITWGVKPGRVKKAIDLAARMTDLSCLAVTPVSWYIETTELADWIRAAAKKKLHHVPALEIVFFVGLREDRLIATASSASEKNTDGDGGALRLDFIGDSLYLVAPILKELAVEEVEYLRLRVHDEATLAGGIDISQKPLLQRFGKDVLDLDEAWSRALALPA